MKDSNGVIEVMLDCRIRKFQYYYIFDVAAFDSKAEEMNEMVSVVPL